MSVCVGVLDELGSLHESVASVEVVGIDNSEAFLESVLSAKESLCCSPRLNSFGKELICGNKAVELLEYVFNVNLLLDSVTNGFLEGFVVFFLDNEYYLVEACLDSVIDGKVNNKFAVLCEWVDLLESAVTRSHTGS